MRLHKLIKDDDAVSPVIGVVLMVAITIILAAVIASFVLGLGQQTGPVSPQASFSVSYDEPNRNLTIAHNNGDPVKYNQLFLRGSNFNKTTASENTWKAYMTNPDGTTAPCGAGEQCWEGTASGSSEGTTAVVAGDELTVGAATNFDVKVVWQSSEGDESNTFIEETGPDA